MQLDNNSDYTVIADAQGTRTQVQFPSQELHKHWRKHQQYVATFQKCAPKHRQWSMIFLLPHLSQHLRKSVMRLSNQLQKVIYMPLVDAVLEATRELNTLMHRCLVMHASSGVQSSTSNTFG